MIIAIRRHTRQVTTLGIALMIGMVVVAGPVSGGESPGAEATVPTLTESRLDYPLPPGLERPLVFGGFDALNPGWITALFLDGSFTCTASLIHPEVVLTAAHCVNGPGDYSVVIGEEFLYAPGIQRVVTQIHINPGWGGNFNDTDLALLALSAPVDSVPVAQLNANDDWPEWAQDMSVAGWGEYFEGSGASPYLQAGDVFATSGMDGTHDPFYCDLDPAAMTVGGMFCFGGPVDVSACTGDSGGPVIGWSTPTATSGDIVVYGVVSYGPSLCSSTTKDTKAQSIGGHIGWINDVVDSIENSVDVVILGGTSAVTDSVAARLDTCTTGAVFRIAGSNRYATAAAVSEAFVDPGVAVAYIATGENFPDALAGSAAAGAGAGGPVLLVKQNSLPSQTAGELDRLDPDVIVVLGGTAAISAGVADSLSAYGEVVRVAGSNRYSTGSLVSSFAFPSGASTAYVATGSNFPDALAGGPAAVTEQGPVLLVQQDKIPSSVRTELARLGLSSIKVLGGTAAVSAAVESDLEAYAANVDRLSGSNRYATAAAVSKDTFSPGVDAVFVATGTNFPDALAGGPIAGVVGGPILLVRTDSIPGATETEIERLTGTTCAAP